MPQERSRALSPAKRVRTFQEVYLGLKKSEAIENARIFLERERSVKGEGCPLGTDYFSALRPLSKGDVAAAYEKILETNPIPGITGRLAGEPFETTQVYNRQGERISLRAIERFLDDAAHPAKAAIMAPRTKRKIAVIGSGVSGLTAAAVLSQAGHPVVVFESAHTLGGSLGYAYGEFRIPDRVIASLVERLRSRGVVFMTGALVGRSMTISELSEEHGFSAILLTTGAGPMKPLGIPGEASAGVFCADEVMKFLRWMKGGRDPYTTPPFLGPKVLVVGSGTIAFEAARSAVRLGRDVTILVRGPESEIKVPAQIVREASEEGIKCKTFVRPVKVEVDGAGCVRGLLCHILDYRVDAAGRLSIVDEEDSEFLLEAQTIVNASAHEADTIFLKGTEALEFTADGAVRVQDGGAATSLRKVFAAGRVTDPQMGLMETVLSAKKAAEEIGKFLQS